MLSIGDVRRTTIPHKDKIYETTINKDTLVAIIGVSNNGYDIRDSDYNVVREVGWNL